MQAGKTDSNNSSNLHQRMKRAIRRLNPTLPKVLAGLWPTAVGQRHQNLHGDQNRMGPQEELLRTQLALETMRSRYFDLLEYTSTLYNSAPVGYFTLTATSLTANDLIVEANLTAATLLTRGREHLLQQPITNFIVAEDQERFRCCLDQLLATQSTQRCEVRMTRADGSLFFVQMDATITSNLLTGEKLNDNPTNKSSDKPGNEQYIRATISDISARVQLEEEERKVRQQLEATLEELHQTQTQMVRQERLAVVGQLAAGIAHDFNNILAAITLYAQLIKRAPDLPAHLNARMEVIVVQTGRATHLIQQILDFSRRTVIVRQPSALSHFLRQFADLLQHTLPETIAIRLDIDALQAGIDDVANIDIPRIQQALLNLALNARDAMTGGGIDGGELHIALSCIIADEHFPSLTSGTLAPGLWLRIDIRDSGIGVPPEELPKIFEPFFTTKDVGSGSGLGLSQVWGIVKQHEGEIDVTSQVGEGTTFSLYLPAMLGASLTVPLPETMATPHGNGELVLVVEDSNILRTALISALQQLGYQVLEAKNGQAAALLMAREGEKIHLILSDLVMPIMSGESLIHSLRVQGWRQPVVVLSGQPLSPSKVEQLYSYGQISWLPKPPTLAQLALALNQALQPGA